MPSPFSPSQILLLSFFLYILSFNFNFSSSLNGLCDVTLSNNFLLTYLHLLLLYDSHGKFESVGSLFLSLTLIATGMSVGAWSYDKMHAVLVAQQLATVKQRLLKCSFLKLNLLAYLLNFFNFASHPILQTSVYLPHSFSPTLRFLTRILWFPFVSFLENFTSSSIYSPKCFLQTSFCTDFLSSFLPSSILSFLPPFFPTFLPSFLPS